MRIKSFNAKLFVGLSLVLSLSACATFSGSQLFTSYNEQLSPVLTALKQNDTQTALNALPQYNSNNTSYVLNRMEHGRINSLRGETNKSTNEFTTVIDIIEKQRFAADIQISKGIETTTSLFTNDNVRSYQIPSYEQTMVHTMQALNYLANEDLEAALVEVRRANIVQELALKNNQQDLEAAALEQRISLNELYSSYPSMDEAIGDAKNGFQNAFTFYLSGFLYEAIGQSDSAYIDYKRAIEIAPNNQYLQSDLLRLSKRLGFNDEYARFKKVFSLDSSQLTPKGQPVLIIFEQGLIPAKQESRIDLPIFTSSDDLRFYSVALPTYNNTRALNTPINVKFNNNRLKTEPIVHLSSLAAKDLNDRLPGIVARQITRVIAKEELRQSAARNGGDVGNIIAAIYNMASERADTRSWLSLPNNYQVAKAHLPNGETTLHLEYQGVKYPISLNIEPNSMTIVKAVSIGSLFDTQVYTL